MKTVADQDDGVDLSAGLIARGMCATRMGYANPYPVPYPAKRAVVCGSLQLFALKELCAEYNIPDENYGSRRGICW
ncbi:MAG: hypothetical protein V3W14_13670 [Candidatus Neomarinimicrobiota bacterium]